MLLLLFDNFFKTSTHALKSSYRSVNGKVYTAKKAAKRLIFVSSSRFFFPDEDGDGDVVDAFGCCSFCASVGTFCGGVVL